MSKRGLKVVLSHSTLTVSSLRSNSLLSAKPSPTVHHPPFKISRHYLLSIISRFVTTSSPDNLDGLVDPDLDFPGNDPLSLEGSRVESVADEFAFLRDALLDSSADCSSSKQKIESGKHSNDAVLISNAIRDNNDRFGDKTQNFLRQFREKLNESLVVDVLNILQSPELGVRFFIWAGRQIGYSHTGAVYDALLGDIGLRKE
ncbi:hypothetical protein L1049_017706 [Liquidambar formosana]|uniref:Pentatricopeptide repeat-containing protein n=1 Tax=Liquidambar formosana TaxID=63359 RepID=A0AAP0S7V3_LIQFO